MARKRVVGPDSQDPEEERANYALRPQSLTEYVGQEQAKERLAIALESSRRRAAPLEHILLHGPPGLGKTTLAHVLAAERGTRLHVTSGPALTKPADLLGLLTRLEHADVLFIDEIHRLPAAVEEYVYSAMEDFRVEVTRERGEHAYAVALDLKPFTLVGATTRPGLLTQALRTRFGMVHHLGFYEEAQIRQILSRAARLLGMESPPGESIGMLASRSRGTPRVALRLLRRVRDFALVRAGGDAGPKVVQGALDLEGVDALGLDALDRSYLSALGGIYGGGPAGLDALAASMGEDRDTLEDLAEPYLLALGFIQRTRQGRRITRAACEHMRIPWRESPDDGALFAEPPEAR